MKITEITAVEDQDQILAPNSHNHGHVSTAFAWS